MIEHPCLKPWIRPVACLALCAFASSAVAQSPPPAVSPEDIERAVGILDAWHAEKSPPRVVRVVCWTPKDRELPSDYEARLTRILKHIQEFYATEMERLGLGRRTFGLEETDAGRIVFHVVTGKRSVDAYRGESGNEIRQECRPFLKEAGIDIDEETVLIFCNLANWDAERKVFRHDSPYYASGTASGGTAWQLDSPELDTANLALREPMIRDGQYGRISLGKHNSIFLGGIAHELGHGLGLPHSQERSDEAERGSNLMGSGNRTYGDELRGEGRGSFLTLADGLQLASHPQFAGSTRGMKDDASASLEELAVEPVGSAIRVSGVVRGEPPVYAVVAYFDPDGGSDYDATTASAIPDEAGRFVLQSDVLPHGKKGLLRIVPLHVNGASLSAYGKRDFAYPYEVDVAGTPNLATLQTRLELAPILAAIAKRDFDGARRAVSGDLSPAAKAIAERLLNRTRPTIAPAEYAGSENVLPLTDFRPESASVGWGRATYDRLPEASALLESGGKLFATGIYAHAPARHRYRVGGAWGRLTGQAGLASGKDGSVQFEVLGDGKSLWKSPVVDAGENADLASFDLPIDGVQELELTVRPTDDGNSSDWGLWLGVELGRSKP